MRSRIAVTLLTLFWIVAFVPSCSQAQQEQTEQIRKVLNRVVPTYPEMARTMNLKGTVKIEVVVDPKGIAKSIKVLGGHPALAQAAENAIRKWKWVPAAHDTTEPVDIRFNPN
jgi:TonB family protein